MSRVISMNTVDRKSRSGFTLIELLAVMVIIGIILGFVLVAGMEASNRAFERATQTLIAKLDAGISDRVDALLQNRPTPNYAHGYLAAIYNPLAVNANLNPAGMIPAAMIQPQYAPAPFANSAVTQTDRAQAFAWYDYLKSELPDVFFIQPNDPNYPINFTGVAFPGTAIDPNGLGQVMLPLGHMVLGPAPQGYGDSNVSGGVLVSTNPNLGFLGSGINGASYPAAAALYKNLPNIAAIGCDGIDNGGTAGLIDDVGEWSPTPAGQQAIVTALQANHQHKTARAEMLYAILVEGSGPWGSVFSRDEFTDKEVQDTDKDGLPEFVDAWGQPLQFFRWPIFYHSDLQRGQLILPDPNNIQQQDLMPPYYDPINPSTGVFRERETDPIDLNRQLVAPGWWSQLGAGGVLAANSSYPNALVPAFAGGAMPTPAQASGGVTAFQSFFHSLSEPYPGPSGATGQFWDRGGTYPTRRAFYNKFLILSSGQDQLPGVFLYSDAAMQGMAANASPYLIANENNAMQFSLDMFPNLSGLGPGGSTSYNVHSPGSPPSFNSSNSSVDPTNPGSWDVQQAGQDDISNHNLQATGGIGGSG
jgi:prepilin-type N-terminal cleavage/methylation domain-containing protein